MPHHAFFGDNIIRESLVEYSLASGEEIFLSYSHGREYGPGIERTGKGPPVMENLSPGAIPGSKTTHPIGQRLQTWLINDTLRADDLRDIHGELVAQLRATDLPQSMVAFEKATDDLRAEILARTGEPGLGKFKKAAQEAARAAIQEAGKRDLDLPPEVTRVLGAFVTENSKLPAHDRHFVNTFAGSKAQPPLYEIIGQQGCGDLTMNLWSVAYVNSPLTPTGKPRLLFLHTEAIVSRTYPCLVKWKSVGNKLPRVSIEDMHFNPNAARIGGDSNEIAWVVEEGKPRPVGDQIEFAVSGKPVIRHGQPVNLGRRTRQFADLRHLLKMVNLNPNSTIPSSPRDTGRPRAFFATNQNDDVWFGEAQLLQDENLQRAAMECPIVLSRIDGGGVSVDHLRAALVANSYEEVTSPIKELDRGEFRFIPGNDTLVEIFFLGNTYAWNIIGLDQKQTKIQAFACECRWGPSGRGHSLSNLAHKLKSDFSMHDALLFDEGQDVFQEALVGGNFEKAQIYSEPGTSPPYVNPDLDITVPLKRKRLRAIFIFARPRPSE